MQRALGALVTASALIVTGSGLARAQTSSDPPPQTSTADATPASSGFLGHSYVGLQVGFIDYPFSASQVQPGFRVQTVEIPHLAVRAGLLGHAFNEYLSVQAGALRPVKWVAYRNINGGSDNHTVWMNVWAFSAKVSVPFSSNASAFGEAGLGVVTRRGFLIGQSPVVRDANYGTILVGGGLEYRANRNWSVLAGITAVPGRAADEQPRTILLAGGVNYTVRDHTPARATEDAATGPRWPKNVLEAGYSTAAPGYGVNHLFTKTILIFWPGDVDVANGVAVNYARNLFHTGRFFALDGGVAMSHWKSALDGDRFFTASVYPILRFPLVRTNPFECYVSYSLAGPAFISKTQIDHQDVGKIFTFQDYMGVGVFVGPKKQIAAEVRIAHYSNGNLFPQNPGITIPLGFYLGLTF